MNSPKLNGIIRGVGLWTAQCNNFNDFAQQMAGDKSQHESINPAPAVLPARERRRAPLAVRLAVEVASQACEMAGIDAGEPMGVFASASGDLDTLDRLFATVTGDDKQVSPTQFHNSVHNAGGGYWAICSGCTEASSFISAGSSTFCVALLEAMTLLHTEQKPVLLVLSDIEAPQAMRNIISNDKSFAAAFVIAPEFGPEVQADTCSSALRQQIQVATIAQCCAWPKTQWLQNQPHYHALYNSNPSARSLVLLEPLLAKTVGNTRENWSTTMPMNHGVSLAIQLEP